MRVLVSGHGAWMFEGVIKELRPEWEVRAFPPQALPVEEMTDGDYDVYILSDDWGVVHSHILPNLPVKKPTIVQAHQYFPDTITQLRRNSIWIDPMVAPDITTIPEYIESIVQVLTEELASPDREQRARRAAEQLVSDFRATTTQAAY